MGKGTSTATPLATHHHEAGGLDQTLEFLKRTRSELRQLRRVLVGQDRLRVCDVNGDAFEIVGLGYADPDIIALLNSINTAYDPRPSTCRPSPSSRNSSSAAAIPGPRTG